MPEVVANQIGRYPIIRQLGEGGMGVVYLCRDDIGRYVAIKTLKPGLPEKVKSRFKEEGNRGDLIHENIVTIYTVSPEEVDPPYIVMEYLDGDPLDRLISGGNGLTLAEKLDVISQVCKGLDYAHSKGVIHRDIKPGNIIRLRDNGRIKIVDFGISKVKRELDTAGLSQTQGIIGTVGYIAPERWLDRLEDGRVDIFSTGVMLYFLITGREPFARTESEAPGSIIQRILNEPYPPLGTYLKDFPEELTNVLDRALAKDPSQRYYTGMEFADDLAILIDELNRRRIPQLLQEAQRHLAESNWQQALERCQEVLKIEPQNIEAKRLRRSAQDGRKAQEVELTIQRLLSEAEAAVETGRYDDAIRNLQEVDRLRPGTLEFQQKLQAAKDKKRIQDEVEDLIRRAGANEHAGDLTGPLQLYQQAYSLAPNNAAVLREIDRLSRKIEDEEGRKKNDRHIFNAEQKIASGQFTGALEILDGVRRSGFAHERLDGLYDEALRRQKDKEGSRLKEQLITQATKLRYAQQFEPALDEVDRGLEVLKGDTTLLRLRQEILSELNEYRQSKSIAETAEIVWNQSLVSIDDALMSLREAMRTMPGVKTFVTLENTLLGKKEEERNRQVRAECMREASEEVSAGRPDRAIQVIESYLFKHTSDPDIDGLLQEARRVLEQRRLRARISECATKARALLDEGRFEEAAGILQPAYSETGDGELAALLERAAQEKSKVDNEVRQLARHVTELRRDGKLAQAINLIEAQPSRTLQSPSLRELLEALTKELERDEALAGAISRAKKAVEAGEWATAREPLDDIRRVFGEFDVLVRALAGFESMRTREADRLTSQSVAAANAAVLAGDKKAAVKALGTASVAIPYATAAVAQDWKKRAEEFNVPVKQELPTPAPKPKFPVWAVGVAAIVFMAVGILLWKFLGGTPQQSGTYVLVTKAPPGASVLIDGVAPAQTDANGQVKVLVKPGQLSVKVFKEGYTSYSDDINVEKGVTYSVPAKLTDTQTTGNLVVEGNAGKFKLFVDSTLLGGSFKPKDKIQIEKGSHIIHYEADGFERSPDKTIIITKGADLSDTFDLKVLANSPAITSFSANPNSVSSDGTEVTLKWRTTNATKASIDGGLGDVQPNGEKKVKLSAAATYTLTAEGSDAKPIHRQLAITLVKQGAPFISNFTVQPPAAKAGDTVTLSWQTKDSTEVTIDQSVGRQNASGSAKVSIPKDAKGQFAFQMVATGKGGTAQQIANVEVIPPPPPPVVVSAPAPVVSPTVVKTPTLVVTAPSSPPSLDPEALGRALVNFETVFTSASGGDKKACLKAFAVLPSLTSPGFAKEFNGFCDSADSFKGSHECSGSTPIGTEGNTKATWSCSETINIEVKGGKRNRPVVPSTFYFARNSGEGTWKVVRWDPRQ